MFPCADPERFVRGSNFEGFFFVLFILDEGREDLNTIISGPSSPASEMPVTFPAPPPPLDPHMYSEIALK